MSLNLPKRIKLEDLEKAFGIEPDKTIDTVPFREPMGAAKEKEAKNTLHNLKKHYPLLVTPKIDGFRCCIVNNHAATKKFLLIPNEHIRKTIEACRDIKNGMDGELVAGKNFQETQSAVTTIEGTPDFIYYIFDYVKSREGQKTPYVDRIKNLDDCFVPSILERNPWIQLVTPVLCKTEKELLDAEQVYLANGFEGLIARRVDARYKEGRSTMSEGYCVALKRFVDSEAVIIGFEELELNDNPMERDNFGLAKRSHAKAGKVMGNMLGSFRVQDLFDGRIFYVGSGLTVEQRKYIWQHKDEFINRAIKYKYQKYGVKENPRSPIFLGMRDVE